jgi:hypothetical protein
MNTQTLLLILHSTFLTLFLLACNTPATTPAPDLVATGVAVEKAVAATLTAEAPTPASAASTPTSPPAEQPTLDSLLTPLPVTPTPPEEVNALPTPTPTGLEAQQTPTDILTPLPLCTVVANGLNLRLGPGTAYEPPIGAMSTGMELNPLTFSPVGFPAGPWLQVQVPATGQTGWVNAGPQYVSCNVEPSSLPLGVVPPTPTAIPTPPPPPQRVGVPPDGGQNGEPGSLKGQIILPSFSPNDVTNPIVFRDKLAFYVEVYDPSFGGNQDGDGIASVTITVSDENGQVYERIERTAHYCIFGGGEPDCNVLDLREQNFWPWGDEPLNNDQWTESDQPISNGSHNVDIFIVKNNEDTEQWIWQFEIDR